MESAAARGGADERQCFAESPRAAAQSGQGGDGVPSQSRPRTGMITHARPLTFGTYPSDSLQPGLGPVDPTSHSASHSGPGPLADTMLRTPHGSWRDRDVRSSFMSTEVSLATSLYATWIVLTSQPCYKPTIPAACRRPSRLCVQTVRTDHTQIWSVPRLGRSQQLLVSHICVCALL